MPRRSNSLDRHGRGARDRTRIVERRRARLRDLDVAESDRARRRAECTHPALRLRAGTVDGMAGCDSGGPVDDQKHSQPGHEGRSGCESGTGPPMAPGKLAGCWTGRADHRAARWRITLRHEPPAARVAGCRLRSGQHPRRLCRRGGRRIQGRPSADVLRRPSRPVVASAGRAVGEPLVVSTDFRSTGPVDPADCHRRRGRHSRNQSIGSFQRGVARLLRNIGNPPRRS